MKIFRATILVLVLIFIIGVPVVSVADTPVPDSFNVNELRPDSTSPSYFFWTATGANGDLEVSPIFVFIREVINFLALLAGSVSLLIFVGGGLYALISEGQEDRLQKAKQAMIYSLTGLAISLMAYVIVRAVQAFFF